MARQPRFTIPGQPQHLIQRGNNRQTIFCNDNDYRYYLSKLKQASDEHQCFVHAYVLMTNHVHLLVTPLKENSISKMMQMLGRNYVHYFNYKYQRTGTLWEGRYKASLIHSEQYLFTCMRYIELNPVRAGMIEKPDDYAWSSYRHNALGESDYLITDHLEYKNLGLAPKERQKAYAALFQIPLERKIEDEIRHSSNYCWVFGDTSFKELIQKQLSRPLEPKIKK